jgi:hemoglobin
MTDDRTSVYEFAGGAVAFLALATELNKRCLEDSVLNHPFSHPGHPEHLERLAGYLGEVFGGPPVFSESCGGHSAMLLVHAGTDAEEDMANRFVACFDLAVEDAGMSYDLEFRQLLHEFMVTAAREVYSISPSGSVVAPNTPMPHWSWNGPSGD